MTDSAMEKMLNYASKLQDSLKDRPHALICSQDTWALLKKQLIKPISERDARFAHCFGMPICSEEYFPDEVAWILNKEMWELYCKEGLGGLVRYMAIENGVSVKAIPLPFKQGVSVETLS